MTPNPEDLFKEVAARHGRYAPGAYAFVWGALGYTVRRLRREGHITGRELLEGVRDLALEEFGGMAGMVFDLWGVRTSEDVGEIVFNLVDAGHMKRTETDSRGDFKGVFDFREVFRVRT